MKLLITAGPTREPIDRVRYISNRSSGKLGVAVASAGAEAGCEVTLLMGAGADWSGVVGLEGCEVVKFESTADLQGLLAEYFGWCDVLVMAAAVSDYRPVGVIDGKLARGEDGMESLALEATPDLVAEVVKRRVAGQKVVSFSLEEAEGLEERAMAKMKKKGVDAVVANRLETMDSVEIDPVWMTADGGKERPGVMSKAEFGRWLIKKL